MERLAGTDTGRPLRARSLHTLFICGTLLLIFACAPSQAERYRLHLTTLLPANTTEQSEVAVVTPVDSEHSIAAVSESTEP